MVKLSEEMLKNILVGFIGACLALLLRAAFDRWRNFSYRKKLAALCINHLEQIRNDLTNHITVQNKKAVFGETQYHEAIVGHFLYDLVTSNIDKFANLDSIRETITFFHHYKVNMSTLRSRLDVSDKHIAQLTEGTFRNLIGCIDSAIEELCILKNPMLWRFRKLHGTKNYLCFTTKKAAFRIMQRII